MKGVIKMEIYQNKASKMNFIHIDHTSKDEVLFVTPECKIKFLSLSLFNKRDTKDEDYLLSHNLLTKEQIERYHQYKIDREDEIDPEDEVVREFKEMLQLMTSWQRERFLYELKNC